MTNDQLVDREEAGFFAPYAEFAKTLRTWFVTYGIGVPALIVSQDKLVVAIAKQGMSKEIGALFLGGVAVQVVLTLLYKVSMWQLYMTELRPSLKGSTRSKIAEWVSEAMGLEALLDFLTLALFVYATFLVLTAVG